MFITYIVVLSLLIHY